MEEKKEGLSRRSFLSNTAVGAIGLAAVGFTAGSLVNPREAEAATPSIGTADFPLPTVAIDVEKVRQYGYYCYKSYSGCGLGSARALLAGILDAHTRGGTDPKRWVDVPLNLYAWCNGGGAGGWGTLCGAIAGSAGVLNLMNLHGTHASKVFEWYTKQNFPLAGLDSYDGSVVFPTAFPAEVAVPRPIPDAEVKGHAVTDSPLCHISVSKWLAAAHVKLGDTDGGSPARGLKEDRCAKVTGDTAAYTAALLNETIVNKTNPSAWAKPAAMAGCFDCHDPSGTAGLTKKDAQTKMDCLPCHTEPTSGRK
ncbi:C-GCAxxG-C-C family protein [Geomonas sp. RF6]|uniref:C-GCAxxG-C-C family (seleno)protein n=1 Tax=Geomonas sp. RF6 TaxID=2897342 RepID=UPI001E313B1E|nr:C-GCAxxG-C-C family (seleno)protein [Geomonas sp. RF6]UFS70465.1 C-GCAxxG-C-C family protein [Geomonas sp. RF6]